jgi:hypothetical protein
MEDRPEFTSPPPMGWLGWAGWAGWKTAPQSAVLMSYHKIFNGRAMTLRTVPHRLRSAVNCDSTKPWP